MSIPPASGLGALQRFAGAISNLAVTASGLTGTLLPAAAIAASAPARALAPIRSASTAQSAKINAINASNNKALEDAKMFCYVRTLP